jgi:amidophosphoribosyltransferase
MGEPGRLSNSPQYCDACFSGDYPTTLTDRADGRGQVQLSLLTEPQ